MVVRRRLFSCSFLDFSGDGKGMEVLLSVVIDDQRGVMLVG